MVPGEDAESDDSDDLWESCRAYNISRVAVPHCPPFEPHSIQVMYFNVFGTLIDHETGIFQALGPLLCRSSFAFERYESLSLYFDAESEMKKRAPQLPYLQILALTYKDMAMRLGLTSTADESSVFASSLFDWPLFDDAVETLRSLHSLVPALVGLVDMDFETCNQLAAYQQLHLYLEGTFAWDGPCTYRPDPDAVYPPLLHHDTLGVPRAHRCIVSNSLVPDLESACWADIPAVWMRCSSTLATNLAITDQNTSFVSMVCTALPKLVSAISDAKVAKSEGVPDVVDVAKLSKLSLVDS
ncbi:hypothetical protein DFH06DRAFT_1018450 [Mycena polygramma]|nr:hypothetical protein DFH06DRAFT_1018450 [Mycena polygramma]